MFDLTGKRALVTGSTQGIGYSIAKLFVEHGAEVWVHCSRDAAKAERIALEISAAHSVVADLSGKDAAEHLYSVTGGLDIVVANASVQFRCPWNEIPADQFDKQVNVNLYSTLALMQKYVPGMQERKWGRFLAVGSVQQYKPHVHMAIYAATKSGIQSLVNNVAKQVAADGVTVNSLLPGVIATPRNAEALADPVYCKQVMAAIPAGYAGTGEDCAASALLLCSEEGRYITGTELLVDGGMHL